MFKKKPPTKIEFTLTKIKNGGYILKWQIVSIRTLFYGKYSYQAFTTYQEAINAITIITEPLT